MMQDGRVRRIVRRQAVVLHGRTFPSTNTLLGAYPGADGVKTGHTTGAGWCIVASAYRNGRRIYAAVLGAASEADRDAAATALLDWGFAQVAA
jgi:D-alanyl-D-alanine carboxypeptidase (penicillin-binding protein 5/6)